MGTDLDTRSTLTADQLAAAILDAQGYNATEIARAIPTTKRAAILKWRKEKSYTDEIERLNTARLDETRAQVFKVTKKLIGAAELAVGALEEALQAERQDGTPDYLVRQKAAETILNTAGGLIVPKGQTKSEDSSSTPYASITVNLGDVQNAEIHPVLAEQEQDAAFVVDTDAEDVDD